MLLRTVRFLNCLFELWGKLVCLSFERIFWSTVIKTYPQIPFDISFQLTHFLLLAYSKTFATYLDSYWNPGTIDDVFEYQMTDWKPKVPSVCVSLCLFNGLSWLLCLIKFGAYRILFGNMNLNSVSLSIPANASTTHAALTTAVLKLIN